MLCLPPCFPYSELRPHQGEIICSVLAGRNVLAVLPTGSGKSLCYQAPGLMGPGPTLVVSPLLALIQDQADALLRMGVPDVYTLSALQSPEDNSAALEAISEGRARFVFAAPERFATPALLGALGRGRVRLVAVDEAHCISEWGHDFRPDYLRLKEVLAQLEPRSVLALTATATPRVQRGILHALGISGAEVVVGRLDRPNLRLEVVACNSSRRLATLASVLREVPALVYVGRKRDAATVADFLNGRGLRSLVYHAGLAPEQRRHAQEEFLSGRVPVLVATTAFGMGVDKPDIRTVVHFQSPGSLEAYFQEAGRAGRDGMPARSVVLYDPLDARLLEFLHERRFPSLDELEQVRAALLRRVPFAARNEFPDWDTVRWNLATGALLGPGSARHRLGEPSSAASAWVKIMALRKMGLERLEAMLAFLHAGGCRRQSLLAYFGQTLDGACGGCDRCREARVVRLRRKPGPHRESPESLSSLASAGENETQARSIRGGNALA